MQNFKVTYWQTNLSTHIRPSRLIWVGLSNSHSQIARFLHAIASSACRLGGGVDCRPSVPDRASRAYLQAREFLPRNAGLGDCVIEHEQELSNEWDGAFCVGLRSCATNQQGLVIGFREYPRQAVSRHLFCETSFGYHKLLNSKERGVGRDNGRIACNVTDEVYWKALRSRWKVFNG